SRLVDGPGDGVAKLAGEDAVLVVGEEAIHDLCYLRLVSGVKHLSLGPNGQREYGAVPGGEVVVGGDVERALRLCRLHQRRRLLSGVPNFRHRHRLLSLSLYYATTVRSSGKYKFYISFGGCSGHHDQQTCVYWSKCREITRTRPRAAPLDRAPRSSRRIATRSLACQDATQCAVPRRRPAGAALTRTMPPTTRG